MLQVSQLTSVESISQTPFSSLPSSTKYLNLPALLLPFLSLRNISSGPSLVQNTLGAGSPRASQLNLADKEDGQVQLLSSLPISIIISVSLLPPIPNPKLPFYSPSSPPFPNPRTPSASSSMWCSPYVTSFCDNSWPSNFHNVRPNYYLHWTIKKELRPEKISKKIIMTF